MATTKVSALPNKAVLTGGEEILITDGSTSKKSTITAVRATATDATKLPLAGGTMTGNIVMSGSETVDGRDVSADGAQLDTNTSAIATKAPIASPTFTGTVAIPNISDLESAVAANTAKTGITTSQANAITANTAKVTNATHTGDVTGATALTIAADAVTTAKIADDAVTADKLANSINSEIAANTAKVTNATHTGEVTGATTLTIADNVVDEANLKISNTPTNGYVLTAQSGNTGGLTWAEISSGNTTANGMWEHAHTIAANYSITSGNNAIAAGPITINSGVSVTVPTGSTWVIA